MVTLFTSEVKLFRLTVHDGIFTRFINWRVNALRFHTSNISGLKPVTVALVGQPNRTSKRTLFGCLKRMTEWGDFTDTKTCLFNMTQFKFKLIQA